MTRGSAGRPVWRGGSLLAVLAGALFIVAVVIAQRGPSASAPGAKPSVSPGSTASPSAPPATSQALVSPVVNRSVPVAELAPTTSMSFPLGDLISVSPDGRFALVWKQLSPANQVELSAIPLAGGEAIRLGVAGYEPRGPDDAVNRLALPAWSADGTAVAFENGSVGTIASLAGGAPINFVARADAPITPLTTGGFVVQAPGGPVVVGGTGSVPVSVPPDLHDPTFFGDGATLVAFTDTGEMVWTDGATRITVAPHPDGRTSSWSLLARTGQFLVLGREGPRLDFGAVIVGSKGAAAIVELPDACSRPDVSDDGRYVAYTVCDNSGAADSYGIRLVRLEDGTALDFIKAVGSPKFIPGTHRLAWLTLSGNPPISPIYTVSVAANEVLP